MAPILPILSTCLTLIMSATSLPHDYNRHPSLTSSRATAKPAYFVLAGDSTTATSSGSGGGWGDGFLNYTLASGSSGHNYGHNGATTKSFRAGGDWDTVLAAAGNRTGEFEVFVTIQFGHNDQKNTSGVTLDQYTANLEAFVREVQDVDATPILVTSLTRRSFSGTPPRIVENLAVQRNLTIQAALATNSRYIDLNQASTTYCNEIGPNATYKYNRVADDYTHLNLHGSVVFGRLVSDLLVDKYDDIRAVTRKNETLTEEIEQGVAARK